MKKRKDKPIPFNKNLSLELDRATVASESKDPVRRKLGQIWKRRLEKKIFGD